MDNTGKFRITIDGAGTAADAQRVTRDYVKALSRNGSTFTTAKFETLGALADSGVPPIVDYVKDLGLNTPTPNNTVSDRESSLR